MATVADYPDGEATSGPTITLLLDQPIDYEVTRYEYEDGGCDVNVQPCGLRRWRLEYEGLTAAELTTLRDHFNLAKGKVNDFEFWHRRDNALYAGVQYEEFRVGRHQKIWSNSLSVVLVKLM